MRTILTLIPNFLATVVLAALFAGCSGKARFEESAKKYFDAGEYEKAKTEYLNLLKIDPANTAAISRMGLIWMEQGAPLRAIPYLREAAKSTPGDLPLRNQLLNAWISVGAAKEAIEEATSILKAAPDSGDALVFLAEAARTPEDLQFARESAQRFSDQNSAFVHLATACFCLRDKDLPGTQAALTKALALDPKSGKALTMAAGIHLKGNDAAGAEAKLKAAAEAAGARSPYRMRYAEYKAQLPAPEAKKQAGELVGEILREAPDYLPALTLAAQLALGANRLDEGMEALEKVFVLDRDNLPARLLQAKGWMALGEPAKAVDSLERILKTFPGHFMAKFQLALASVQNGNPAKAILLLQEIVSYNPGFGDATLLLAELNLRSGEAKAVVAPVEALLKQSPAHPLASYLLAGAYQQLNRTDEAINVMKKLIDAVPRNPGHHFRLGEILRAAGQLSEARLVFEEILEMAPGSLPVITQLVDLDVLEKNEVSALARINKVLEEKPDDGGAHFLKAKVHASFKSWKDAEAALLKSIDLDAANPEAYHLLASIYVETGRLPEASARLEAFLAKKPGDIPTLRQAAIIYDKQGEYAKSAAANEKLLSVLPAPEAMILNDLAWLLIEHLNQPDRAFELASKARGLRPGSGEEADVVARLESAGIADTLGWIHFKRGAYNEALALIREAALVIKDNPHVQFHLGKAAYMMAELDEARAAFKIAAEADFPGREEARSKLAVLGETGATDTAMPVSELEALSKKDPNDVVVHLRLAEALEKAGNYEGAAASFEGLMISNPNLPAVAIKLARLYAGPLPKLDKALEAAKKARSLAPRDAAAAGVLGEVEYKRGNFAEAYELLQESARERKSDPEVLKNLGWSAYTLGKVSAAREAMEQLIKAAPGTPEAAKATSFLSLIVAADDPAAAAAALPAAEALLKNDPNHVPALMVRAAVQSQKSGNKEAAGTYEDILKHLPDFASAQKQLAALYADEPQNRDRGYTLALKARESLPNDPLLAQTLGVISYHRKEYANAVQLFEESHRSRPMDAQGLFYSGMARYKTGDNARAKESLTRALTSPLPKALEEEARKSLVEIETVK